MPSLSRRAFLSGLAATPPLLAPLARSRAIRGANEDLRVGVIGLRGRGRDHIEGFARLPGVRVVGLCDPDGDVLAARAHAFTRKHGVAATTHRDLRELLDRSDIDAVSIATPNHWHALAAVWACQAGKDVYVEKPLSHGLWEGRQVVRAARAYDRVVQGGTQSRSHTGIREAVAFARAGGLGAIRAVHGLCYKPRRSIGSSGRGELPPKLDYDLWCGPAPLEPLAREELHYDWHWVHATGNGDLGNQGIHQMDVARWVLGHDALPPRVCSIGGRVGYDDDGETPNTHVVWLGYEPVPLIFEVRGLPCDREHTDDRWERSMDSPPGFDGQRGIGVIVTCDDGKLVIDTGKARAYRPDGTVLREFTGEDDHYQDFVAAVRKRDPHCLSAECEQTHLSTALCHLGMAAHLVGMRLPLTEALQRCGDAEGLPEAAGRMRDHLVRNGIDVEQPTLVCSDVLSVDVERERFAAQHRAANALLRRHDRAPFAVPEIG